MKSAAIRGFIKYLLTYEKQQKNQSNPEPPNLMANVADKTPDSPEDQIKLLQKENNRLQRIIKRHETQLQHLDKMASANEKTNIALYKELEVLQQQAEAQAREAEIQLALERVRARTMAMLDSNELSEAVQELFVQFQNLRTDTVACWIGLIDVEANTMQVWSTGGGMSRPAYTVNGADYHHFQADIDAFKNKDAYRQHAIEEEIALQVLKEQFEFELLPSTEATHYHLLQVRHHFGFLGFGSWEKADKEVFSILQRFCKVFEQTYTRFLDLQKAEAQAREAQIEAALERVRARSLAMHKSDELIEVIKVLHKEIAPFGIAKWGCAIHIFDKSTETIEIWIEEMTETVHSKCYHWPRKGHSVLEEIWSAWEEQKPHHLVHLKGKAKNDFDHYIFENTDYREWPEEIITLIYGIDEVFFNAISMGFGQLFATDVQPSSESNIAILQRFAKVFQQAYTRFLDIERAEAQAREAQIEAALERVRARAMAMHSSEDLSDTVNVFFRELKNLGITPIRCGVAEVDEETRSWTLAATSASEQGQAFEILGGVKRLDHPVLENIYKHWQLQKEYYPVLQGAALKAYYQVLRPQVAIPDFWDETKHYGNYFYFNEGFVFALTERELSGEEVRIFRRFTSVLSLTYRRYMDIKEAEARAREAEQQASLDRVRAEIASMRTAGDLQRITPLVWRELTTLSVPFFRCGVFIIEEATEQAHVYLSTPAGEAVAALHLKFDSAPVVEAVVQNWRQQQVYREEWNREQFIAWTQSILKQGLIDSPEKYQAGGEAPEKLVLQFMPFAQGMLYIGSSAALSDDEIAIGQALAKAFGVAYARYEDFQRLEAAKAQIEAALDNLKKTQGQLVQAEKMASLGQLTAGIAHEIKNPLNFVNNFAALSVDLAKELREEIGKIENGGLKFEDGERLANMKEILEMLEQNAEKINHHGKRADGIVHAMMQHARGGKGERQPTDVNKLVEEYVNLSYHGMRAKVPDFNVSIEQDFGELDGKIEMVPQDIGRVLLNLLSNAFDAVREKKQSGDGVYSPSVAVSTRAVGGAVEIRVRDNGGGIPDEVREKIFEPFFTTKPTGSGTGLGLSLSFDIVTQGHGGTLTVESTQGEGATFVVTLPVKGSATL